MTKSTIHCCQCINNSYTSKLEDVIMKLLHIQQVNETREFYEELNNELKELGFDTDITEV